ncbi:MAG: hypothetical protein F6K37_31135 [Moorea sp. SIO4E2]|uniref:hypothetical protein n=1 Tax=Moorena sp. SIO4E2 TaxID=2607826 RepID=UPI0013BE4FCE|nr:hypothetical protein [Moorena sp. SIO4E2]NEQ10232.1 hypothetical protein [Moorena sp. SIO4E2]
MRSRSVAYRQSRLAQVRRILPISRFSRFSRFSRLPRCAFRRRIKFATGRTAPDSRFPIPDSRFPRHLSSPSPVR